MPQVIAYGVAPGAAGPRTELHTGPAAGPAPKFGTVAWVGAFPWGPVDKPVEHTNLGHFTDWSGPWTFEEEASRAVAAGYDEAGDKMRAECVRILDGEQLSARLPVFNRAQSRSTLFRVPPGLVQEKVAEMVGAFPGERGGRRALWSSTVANIVTAISGATFDTAITTFALNRWKGAELSLPDIAGETWFVESSDVNGVLTLDHPISTALTGARRYALRLGTLRFEGTDFPDSLALFGSVRQNQAAPTAAWDLQISRDGGRFAKKFDRLDYSPDRNAETLTVAARDVDLTNPWMVWDDLFGPTGLGVIEDNLPCDFASLPVLADPVNDTSGTYKVRWWSWSRAGVDDGGSFPSVMTGSASIIDCTITLTYLDATNWTVAIVDANGQSLGTFANGVNGTPYDAATPEIPDFTITTGATPMTIGDTIVIEVRPVPAVVAGAPIYLFPSAFTAAGVEASTTKYVVTKTTFESVTVAKSVAVACDADVVRPGAPSAVGSLAPTYDCTGGKTFKWFDHDGADALPTAERTITESLAGAAETAAAVVADLNAQILALYVSAALVEVEFFVDTTGRVGFRSTRNVGALAKIKITTGTLNPVLGFVDNTTLTGTDGMVVRLEIPRELRGGFDGVHGVVAATIADALNPNDSPLDELNSLDLGLVHVAAPGFSDALVVNGVGDYTFARGYMGVVETPRNLDTEELVAAWRRANLNATGTVFAIWPPTHLVAYAPYRPSPTTTDSLLGPFLGRKAQLANEVKGYHFAMANLPRGRLRTVRRLPGSTSGGFVVRDEVTNGAGIVAINHRGPNVFAFGDQAPDTGGGTAWIHKLETVLLIGRLLHDLAMQFAYDPIPEVWTRVKLYAEARLLPLHKAGAFKAASFEEAVQVVVGKTNNPEAVQNAGNVIVSVRIRGLIDAAKNVTFIVTSDSVAVIEE